ncbi:MAG TPA: PQQ-dependent methanol/ethanol family dehydrogenase [Rhodocyclaceae bacterium]|nr:PQQ-dependent methanol/ethanol family dehydrogenase [Rhodocyclaceae bacterium]HNB77858.1 PQQ-dependent methanol/ethanol family dehydrogenase [Rhodocyclaceae bacterium]HNC62192.1 PQQ-dependent methanol/ethanol family dehydrogenase [Rhodocyclaceae bacterium]HNH12871.1 PQQ-dependent methanol/ethanol family dehydrogenase [Rhodocyclaceae bacterium]HNH99093.1 PQQ-dependent methanol/ethanol family dehydrogenase [Rhodocyclaceae bacterium]
MKKSIIAALIGASFALSGSVYAGVTTADIENDAKSTGDVLSWGIGTEGQRYSPLSQINTSTVKNLVPAWSFSFGGEKQRGQESQPVIANGKMFVTGSYSRLFALDAKTGKKLWQYEHRLPDGIMPCCDVVNRGAALFDNLVIFSTLDAQLVALEQDTGKVVWKEKLDDYAAGYSNTAAPIIAKGLLLTGVSGGEFGIVGRVDARDPKTGKLVWTRPTVEGHMGYKFDAAGNKVENGISGTTNKSWPGDLWKTGGAATWLGGTYDSKTGLAYFGTGNPAPWNSHTRPGDNLFSCSTVAIDVATGQIKWAFQGTPNDGWDYDGVNEFVTYEAGGKRLGGKADRNGFFYVLDANTGKFENGFPFVKKITWAKGLDKDGRPIYDPANRPGDPTKGADGKKGEMVFSAPSFLGGKNQMPMAYSPDTGLFYVPANEWGMEIWNEPITYKKGAAYLGAGFTIKTLPAADIGGDYIGAMRAFDPKTGKLVWEVKNNAPLWGGVLTTKGGLVFWGTPEGFLKAADAKTGKEVWSFNVGTGIVAPPVSWEQDGEQYVGVAAGWGGAVPLWGGDVAKKVNFLNQGGSMWVFKLHKG